MSSNTLWKIEMWAMCVQKDQLTVHTDAAEWEDNLTQMIQPATNIATSSCICKACGDDFKRNKKPQYTPRWVKPNKVCVIPVCKCAESPIVC